MKKLLKGLLTLFIILITCQRIEYYWLVVLEDGSKVYLKNDASLSFYTGRHRYAELVGEATFDIMNSPKKFSLLMINKGRVALTDCAIFSVSKGGVYVSEGTLQIAPYNVKKNEKLAFL